MPRMRYREFGPWLSEQLGGKVQKLSVDGGFSCPNRDGRLGREGCAYCNNASFRPAYCGATLSIKDQITEGKRFFGRKYPDMRYLAYFQTYSNTYAPADTLRERYEEALEVDGVVGLVVSTRPDCLPEEVVGLLAELGRRTFVMVELGIESTDDALLRRVGRGHDFDCVRSATERLARCGIAVGGHLIFGLPGTGDWTAYLRREAERISALPLTTLKIHQLQIVRGTRLAQEYAANPWLLPTADEHIAHVVDFIEQSRPSLVFERFVSQSPPDLLAVPGWGLKNHEFAARLRQYMEKTDSWQGKRYEGK